MDAQLATAIEHWGPRFTANGVDASDFAEVARAVESWPQWCAAWSTIGARHAELGHLALEEGRARSGGEHLAQAATAYHFAQFLFFVDRDEARAAHERAAGLLTEALPLLDPPGERHVLAFDGAHLFGVLRRPAGAPAPVVVLVPGLDSTKEELRLVERSFLDRGLATFALDGPGQGEAEAALPIRADWEVPIAALVDHLEGCDGVDANRVALWGVSLGGYYAACAAAGEPRIAACVSLAGPYCFGDAWDGLPSLTRDAFTVRSHSGGPDDARARALELDLTGRAASITCPLLVVFGKKDRLFPWRDAARLVDEASGPAELLLLEDGNHGCANGIYRHRPATADWVARQLIG